MVSRYFSKCKIKKLIEIANVYNLQSLQKHKTENILHRCKKLRFSSSMFFNGQLGENYKVKKIRLKHTSN